MGKTRIPASLVFIGLILTGIMSACSSGDSLYTNKVSVPSMTSKLYGSSSQIVSINHQSTSHISWMGFIQGNDYNYFKVTKVQVGSETIIEDGEDNYTANPAAIIKNININPTSSTGSVENEYINGSINVAGSGDLKIKFTYSPTEAIQSDSPHEAYYIIYYDTGMVRIKLTGYTQGILAEKCTGSVDSMELLQYKVKDDTVQVYVCGSEVSSVGMANATDHGSSTNLTDVPFPEGSVINIYKADAETVCVLSVSAKVEEPTIPDFVLPIPEGLAPITEMDVALLENDYAECSLDADGNVFCDANVPLDVGGLLPLSGFTLTNQTLTAEQTKTPDCQDFGEISGSGVLDGSSDMSIVIVGEILPGTNSDAYNVTGAAVIGVVNLEPL